MPFITSLLFISFDGRFSVAPAWIGCRVWSLTVCAFCISTVDFALLVGTTASVATCCEIGVSSSCNMPNIQVEAVSTSTIVGEAPYWNHDEQKLYFVDILDSQVRSYDPATKKETKLSIDGSSVSFVIPIKCEKNKFLISIGRDICILEWDGVSDKATSIKRIATADEVEGKKKNRLNDGKADPTGRLWTGTMGAKLGNFQFQMNNGILYSMSKNGTLTAHVDGVSISNGMTWSLDNKLMYYTDSFAYTVDVFDFDIETGQLSNCRLFYDYKSNNIEGHPDGMTIDTEGRLYFPCFGGSQVLVVSPCGKLLYTIPIPAQRVTSVTFGGENLDELFVTTATEDATEEEMKKFPLAGCTFKVTGHYAKGFPSQPVILDESLLKT